MIYKEVHRKLMIEQHEYHQKKNNAGAREKVQFLLH